MQGIKHLIQCHCILPIMRNMPDPVFHSFVAFSVLDEKGEVIPKQAQCNNCGVIHSIVDLCKSEILKEEDNASIITVKDIEMMIPSELVNLLKNYNCDLATWEFAHFIISNDKWGERIVLSRETKDEKVRGKILTIDGRNNYKIESFEATDQA